MPSRKANKTRPGGNLEGYLATVKPQKRRREADTLLQLFTRATGMEPQLWGSSIIGYGRYHYRYESGREGDYFLTGFSPRKAAVTVYVMPGLKKYDAQLERLGPHRHSVSCLYLANLARNDLDPLTEIIEDSVSRMKSAFEWRPA